MNLIEEFNEYREQMNDKILAENIKVFKHIFNLVTNAFAVRLDKSKEMMD